MVTQSDHDFRFVPQFKNLWGTLAQRIMYYSNIFTHIFTLFYIYKKSYKNYKNNLKILNKNPILVDNMEETIIVYLKKGTLP